MASNIPIDWNEPPYDVEDAVPRSSRPIHLWKRILTSKLMVEKEIMCNRFSMSSTTSMVKQWKQDKTLTNAERWAVYHALLEKSVNGSYVDVSSRKARNCGHKRIEVDLNRIQQIEWHQRTTLTSLSNALGVSCSKLHNLFMRGVLRRHSSAIKPHLKDENKISRLEFCLSMLDESTTSNEPKFKGMYNYVPIDEKWFYMTKKEQTYYLLNNEEDPHRSCQSKNNIAKVMFLAATARPRFDGEGRVVFSSKVGYWAFVTEQPTQRNSRNIQAGTMEMKAITSGKRENVKAFLIEKVILAITEKWPSSGETIYVQQDNARTHVPPNDPDFGYTVATTKNVRKEYP
ncbi:mariner transposase [Striga asiatica]|uniref:Mariner transposase n=1 Tax=Striga asiatica TaxID=4170 RepID=A0A5A7PJF0_STRAF|nr:mariner transposase [Striga asiatica]